MHALGEKYGCRPSSFFAGDLTPLEAFSLDVECLRAGLDAEKRAHDRAKSKARRR